MTSQHPVYLAGPDVFFPNAQAQLATKGRICAALGLRVLLPVDNETLPKDSPHQMAMAIYTGNVASMNEAAGMIANITPFRGPHMDPGTAFEVGYCIARGIPVVCYSDALAPLADRLRAWSQDTHESPTGLRDAQGSLIEEFELQENLMIECAMAAQEGQALGRTPPLGLMCHTSFEAAALALAAHLR